MKIISSAILIAMCLPQKNKFTLSENKIKYDDCVMWMNECEVQDGMPLIFDRRHFVKTSKCAGVVWCELSYDFLCVSS